MKNNRGYTLIELIIAVGLFALVMTLASGAYLVMIGINRQTQGIATGINNLSFALETMTRDIRTGTNYSGGGGSFTFTSADGGSSVTYALRDNSIVQNNIAITDPSVEISSLVFSVSGIGSFRATGDRQQARVTIIVSGTVPYAAGKNENFTIQTGATMRGSDI